MRHSILTASILLVAGATAPAHGARPVDVIVYVKGYPNPPAAVDYAARAAVTWMYARIGVCLEWRDGNARSNAASGNSVIIQVRMTETRGNVSPEALANASPFAYERSVIDVFYSRIRAVAGNLSLTQAMLAHVLAHEIGHVLQRTNGHAETGIMKARWKAHDIDAMARKPLEFTSVDAQLIREGVDSMRVRAESAREQTCR